MSHELHGHRVSIAPPAVIAVLKMISYLDRPHERQRDLEDLAHLFDEYVGADDDRRFDEGLGLGLDFDLVPAYLLAKDIGALVHADAHAIAAIQDFLEAAESTASADLRRRGPAAWRRDDAAVEERVAAFRRGLGDGQAKARP